MKARMLDRRRVLRGMLNGAAVTVALPLLDCFLNESGTAMASGAPLPVCFGTWFAGLGFHPGTWEPKQIGANYEMRERLKPLAKFQKRINIYSGLNVLTNGQAIGAHNPYPAHLGLIAPYPGEPLPASIDSNVADVHGKNTRFRSIEVACFGKTDSLSRRAGSGGFNPSDFSPTQLYTRIFGSDFRDPNAADFKPDPTVIVNKSVLSAVAEQRNDYVRTVGASDRARLDEYFTSLRQIEQQLAIQLQKPAPMAACSIPQKVSEMDPGYLVENAMLNCKLFTQLLAHAMACDQTRIFNLMLSDGASGLRVPGSSSTFHLYTHEEPVDPETGLQPHAEWFRDRNVDAFATALEAFDSIKEGDGTLLDRLVVFYSTENGDARIHLAENVPIITAGSAGGRLKTGMHLSAKGDPVTRVGLTLQQALSVPTSRWGTEALATSRPFTEVLA
jgi:hypothetical protein